MRDAKGIHRGIRRKRNTSRRPAEDDDFEKIHHPEVTEMKSMKYLTLGGAVLALVFSAGFAAAKGSKSPVFTISQGAAFTIMPTSGLVMIPIGTTGYSNALLSAAGHRA